MRVLLLDPLDSADCGAWASQRWDRVIDLGQGGVQSSARAAATFGCVVTPLNALRQDFKEMRRVRDLLKLGLGRLGDEYGLDWWELNGILVHHQLESVIVLRYLLETLGPRDEVYISRPGFQAEVLRLELGNRLHIFPIQGSRAKRRIGHYVRVLKRFPPGQLLEIFWDKTDPGFQLRGRFRSKCKRQNDPTVLLPSAYGNASRTGLAYAATLPDTPFLLVATRRSGWIEHPPANVATAWLRAYASVGVSARNAEYADILHRWDLLRRELESVPEYGVLTSLGCFGGFPDRFARGLEIRDAWRNVLDAEPVQAVICADDSNPYTHIPLILAEHRGLPTISCHHGALDGRYMFKNTHADIMLAKGRMEEDYLVRVCGVPAGKVEVGAPVLPENLKPRFYSATKGPIIFFSEGYEVGGGRGLDFYQDILPPLADLAVSEKRELIVKLHPAESLSERGRLVAQVLSAEQQERTRVTSDALPPEVLSSAWFGVTVLSTTAVECAQRGIPCFLCKWLECWPYGYVDQFARFGAGIRLNGPEEINQIPGMLRDFQSDLTAPANWWSPIAQERLRMLLGMGEGQQAAHLGRTETVGKT